MGLIERYGSGIHRILEACQKADLPEPLLENFSGGFRIKFVHEEKEEATDLSNAPLNEGLNEGLKSLLKTINEHPDVQAKDLAKILNRPIKTVERQIKVLTDKNLIERRGSKKTGL